MSRFILDASVAFKSLVVETDSDKATRLIEDYRNGVHDLIAPDVLPIEVGHALTRAERTGRISIANGFTLWSSLMVDCPQLFPALTLMPRAYGLSSLKRIGIYDCLYVALSEQEGCEIVTDDSRLAALIPKSSDSPLVAVSPPREGNGDKFGRDDLLRLTRAVEEATQVGHVLWQTIEELRIDLVHELRNFMDRSRETNGVAESLCCYNCDAGQGMSLAEALQEGWTDLQRADGATANYHGYCPSCQQQMAADDATLAATSNTGDEPDDLANEELARCHLPLKVLAGGVEFFHLAHG